MRSECLAAVHGRRQHVCEGEGQCCLEDDAHGLDIDTPERVMPFVKVNSFRNGDGRVDTDCARLLKMAPES